MEEQKEENQVKGNKKRYRQKNKKSSPIPKTIMSKPLPSSYVEQKQKEIPMYDPYTGEPNPHYEQLTGKKNPLLENKIDAISNTKNGNNHKITSSGKDIKVPEFGRKNRFLVILDKELGIKPFYINSLNGPKINFDNVNVLGLKTFIKKYAIEDIVLKFKSVFDSNINKKLVEIGLSQKYFDFKIEILEPNGEICETWLMIDCQLKSVDFGTHSYDDDSFSECELIISPSDYIIE